MGEDCLSCLTCVLSFCLFEQYNMFKVKKGSYILPHYVRPNIKQLNYMGTKTSES